MAGKVESSEVLQKKDWGDENFEEEGNQRAVIDDPSISIIEEEHINSKGQRVTKTIKTEIVKELVNQRVLDRRKNWKPCNPLAACAQPPQIEEIDFIFEKAVKKCQKSLEEQLRREVLDHVDHPKKTTWARNKENLASGSHSQRSSQLINRQDEHLSIRVSSLSEEVSEEELRRQFGRYGQISRVFFPKDSTTGRNKGFAFVSFPHREDAENAMKDLQGFGMYHLIWQLEWSLPKS